MNYEHEISLLLLSHLKLRYGVADALFAYRIFMLRFLIANGAEFLKNKNIARKEIGFIKQELNLPQDEDLFYKGEKIVSHIALENSLSNIFDDWHFTYGEYPYRKPNGLTISHKELILSEATALLEIAKKKVKVRKRDFQYQPLLRAAALIELNRIYELQPTPPSRIMGFEYPATHNDYAFTLDEESLAYQEAFKHTNNKYTESDLEDYLVTNLHNIENGLTLFERQSSFEYGRLDILAKDSQGTFCVIELKIQEDTRLLWQSIYYPQAVKKKYGINQLRMLIIAPAYPQALLTELRKNAEVELFTYRAKLKNNKIQDLSIKKIA